MLSVALLSLMLALAAPVRAQGAGDEITEQATNPPGSAPSPDVTQHHERVESAPLHSSIGWSRVLDGHLALGAGTTYQYDGSRGTTLGLATYTWRDDHYELAAFRFLTAQTRLGETLADPSWVFEFSRRWQLLVRSGLRLFVGGGAAYKNRTDNMNGSHLNFAEQLGWRFPRQANGAQVEFAIRHISNAGLKKPNKGQDFLTLAYKFGSPDSAPCC
jgi:Lipid A 3-O-deacylase (PagL)